MENLKRTIFFWTLVILFLITAPTVVLRARGYRFDLNRGVFVHSGSISIKSNPQNVDVDLNGELIRSKTLSRINNSYNISGLIPKEYGITISAPDFQTWNKKIEVHSGLSTEIWNSILVRKNYEKTPYDSSGIDKFFISPKDKFVVFDQKIESRLGIKILNLKDNAIENSFELPEWDLADDSREENIEWSPEEDYLSVPVQRKVATLMPKNKLDAPREEKIEYAYFILNPINDEYFNLNEFLGQSNIRNVRWDPREKNFLFFLNNHDLYRASISDKNYLSLIASSVTAYELSESNIYWTQSPTQLVYKSNLDGTSDKAQMTFSFPKASLEETSKLIVYDENRIAFINYAGELFVYNDGDNDDYFRKLADSVEGIQFSNDGKKLLYWSKNEISVYFLRNWDVQPIRSENEIQNITRYSEELKNVQWFKDYEHIIFSVGPNIKIIELDSRDHRNLMDLPTLENSSPLVIYNNSLENLFFVDKMSDTANALYSIMFPEKIGIFGF
ncbi:MAG: hypothetical protein A2Z52_00300 [Candidatus Moranbacteria bacterium RBG_19FT_COMBO_42_6]|nr:MAG: hypothetical protein A2Z52_00300 [Candidatus Moranbacteria bacterium RBG_19FT_COMBO_42_6]